MTRILVIEDETHLLEEIIDILSFQGFEVAGAKDGYQGIQKAYKHRPDLIISDIMMPGLDGYGVLLELRSDPLTSTTPFIFLTAKAERADLRRGMEFGADDYLTKPFTIDELLNAVNMRLEKHKAITEKYQQQVNELRQVIDQTIPHEIRTPLTLMLGYADMLVQDYDVVTPDQLLMMASSIRKAGTRLQRLIENYLLYTQLEIVGIPEERVALLRKQLLNSSSTVIESVIEVKAQERQREADLVMDIPAIEVLISENDLRKVAEELIDNALKFSEPGSPVYATLVAENSRCSFTITDHGRGMTTEQLERIGAYRQFERERFEQQGLGLGLIVSKRLVEIYGGEFSIQSELDRGTTVSVNLPCRQSGVAN